MNDRNPSCLELDGRLDELLDGLDDPQSGHGGDDDVQKDVSVPGGNNKPTIPLGSGNAFLLAPWLHRILEVTFAPTPEWP